MPNETNWYDDFNSERADERLREMYNEAMFRDLILDPSYTLELSTDPTGSRIYWSFMPVCVTEPVVYFGNVYSGMLIGELQGLGFDA